MVRLSGLRLFENCRSRKRDPAEKANRTVGAITCGVIFDMDGVLRTAMPPI
jgi:hypothetical protein